MSFYGGSDVTLRLNCQHSFLINTLTGTMLKLFSLLPLGIC